jgi:hypothetical protein
MKILLSLFFIFSFIASALQGHAATPDFCAAPEISKPVEVEKTTVRSELWVNERPVNDYSHLNTPEKSSTSEIIKSIREKKLTIRSEFRSEKKLVNDYSHLNAQEKKRNNSRNY